MKNRQRARQRRLDASDRQRHLGRHDRWKWIALGKFTPEAIFNELLKALYLPKGREAFFDYSPMYELLRRR